VLVLSCEKFFAVQAEPSHNLIESARTKKPALDRQSLIRPTIHANDRILHQHPSDGAEQPDRNRHVCRTQVWFPLRSAD